MWQAPAICLAPQSKQISKEKWLKAVNDAVGRYWHNELKYTRIEVPDNVNNLDNFISNLNNQHDLVYCDYKTRFIDLIGKKKCFKIYETAINREIGRLEIPMLELKLTRNHNSKKTLKPRPNKTLKKTNNEDKNMSNKAKMNSYDLNKIMNQLELVRISRVINYARF